MTFSCSWRRGDQIAGLAGLGEEVLVLVSGHPQHQAHPAGTAAGASVFAAALDISPGLFQGLDKLSPGLVKLAAFQLQPGGVDDLLIGLLLGQSIGVQGPSQTFGGIADIGGRPRFHGNAALVGGGAGSGGSAARKQAQRQNQRQQGGAYLHVSSLPGQYRITKNPVQQGGDRSPFLHFTGSRLRLQ